MKRPFARRRRDPEETVTIPTWAPLESDEPLGGDDGWVDEVSDEAGGGALDEPSGAARDESEAEPVDEAGWLDAGDEADDADIGDLAEGLVEDDSSWRDDDRPGAIEDDAHGISHVDDPSNGGDDAEGPDDVHDSVEHGESLRRDDDLDDEGSESLGEGVGDVALSAAFQIRPPARATMPLHAAPFAVQAAAAVDAKVVLLGTSSAVFEATRAGAHPARRPGALALDEDTVISGARVGATGIVASTLLGRTYASDDIGAHWREVFAEGPREPRELFAVTAGVYGRSASGGLSWGAADLHGWAPVEGTPPVEALVDEAGAAFATTEGGVLWRATSPMRFTRVRTARIPPAVAALHVGGEAWVAQARDGSVRVAARLGAPWIVWPPFEGATALAIVAADDGMIQVLAAVPDASRRVTTLVLASIARDGSPSLVRRVVDVEGPASGIEDDDEALIDAILPLPAAPRMVVLVGSAGVVAVALDDEP